jgi:TorA maturation chaperone TorD
MIHHTLCCWPGFSYQPQAEQRLRVYRVTNSTHFHTPIRVHASSEQVGLLSLRSKTRKRHSCKYDWRRLFSKSNRLWRADEESAHAKGIYYQLFSQSYERIQR